MKKGIAVVAALFGVVSLIGTFTSAGGPNRGVMGVVGAALIVLAVVLWTRKGKTVQVQTPQPGSTVDRAKRDSEIVLESLQIMNDTKRVDTFCSRYKVARETAARIKTYAVDRAAADDLITSVDDGFCGQLLPVVDRELETISTLKTPKGRRDRAEKLLYPLRRTDVYVDRCGEAITEAINRIEAYIAVQS